MHKKLTKVAPPNGTLECYLCHKSHKSRSDLRQHIFCHLKQEIQNKFYPGEEPIKSCVECTYKSIQPEHILMHLALKHQKIAEFVPKEVIKMIYKDKSIKVLFFFFSKLLFERYQSRKLTNVSKYGNSRKK